MVDDDRELQELLHYYTVENADAALLDSIVAQAASGMDESHMPRWQWKNAALLAATALLGFWFGTASLPSSAGYAPGQQASSDNVNLDTIILGPTTFNEVML